MASSFRVVNIREALEDAKEIQGNEQDLHDVLADFSCPKNPDVEAFLHNNAIEFTKKSQSVTYLVLDPKLGCLVGYFALAMKPVSVRLANISKTMAKKLSRVSILDCFFIKKIERAQLLVRF